MDGGHVEQWRKAAPKAQSACLGLNKGLCGFKASRSVQRDHWHRLEHA
jgi:hypothetical protein